MGNDILYVSGSYGNGCDSFSQVIVRSGWVESGYELGVPDSNQCYGYQRKLESYGECKAAAQAFGYFFETYPLDVATYPQGCFYLSGEVFYNIHSVGSAMAGRTPMCERTHTLLIRQTISSKLWTAGESEVNANDPDNDNYAILNELESFRSVDGRFYFALNWPNANEDVTMQWSQSSNPLTENIAGYEEIDIDYTGQYWGGLEPSTNALMDGSVSHGNWFYAVGAYRIWNGGIPAYGGSAKDQVELYVQKKLVTEESSLNCYDETYKHYLSGYPSSATKCNPGGCTFEEAKAHCDSLSDCGGVTLDRDGLYTVRAGTVLKSSPDNEWSYLKSCGTTAQELYTNTQTTCHNNEKLSQPCNSAGGTDCTESECRQHCIDDASCTHAFAISNGGCILYSGCSSERKAGNSGTTYAINRPEICYRVTTAGWNCPNGFLIDGIYQYSGEINGKSSFQNSYGMYLRWASTWTQWIFDDDTVDTTSVAFQPSNADSTAPPTGTFLGASDDFFYYGSTCGNNADLVQSLQIVEEECSSDRRQLERKENLTLKDRLMDLQY